jgi:hypothetical protein
MDGWIEAGSEDERTEEPRERRKTRLEDENRIRGI